MTQKIKTTSGAALRSLSRNGQFNDQTAGQAPDHLQGNVVILPRKYASDFLQFCLNNPKPCPLIGMSEPGNPAIPSLGKDIDIRTDVPRYRIFKHGEMTGEANDISGLWTDDMVTFVLGCSFTFEEALVREGFGVRHIEQGCNVPMFKTNIPTIAGGAFNGPVVVSMRPHRPKDIPAIFDLCAQYPHAHGAPLYWGDPKGLGIADIQVPDFGDAVPIHTDEVPVFWACGVTPQAAIRAANPDTCITHAPGYMLVTDIKSDDRPDIIAGMAALHAFPNTQKYQQGDTL